MSFTYQNTTKLKGKPEYNFNDVSIQCYTLLYTHIKFNQNDKFLLPPQYEKVFSLLEFFHSIFKYFLVQSPSHVQLFVIPWTAAHQASLSLTVSWSLFKFMSIE